MVTGPAREAPPPRIPARGAWRGDLTRLALLWVIGGDLRLTVLAVPPVLPLIHHDLALSEGAIGALSGLPVLLLGLGAIPGSLLIARLGARRAAIVGLLIVAAASMARGIGPSVPVLFAATLVMGAGVAVLQPALPSLVGLWFGRIPGFATAVYANGLLIGEAVPAALTLSLVLPLVGGSWPLSFVFWSVPVALTAILVAWLSPHQAPDVAAPARRWWPDWHRPLTWQLGLLAGGTGGLYFSTNAFVPGYLHAIGEPGLVGPCLGALNLGQLPASGLILVFARRLVGAKAAFLVLPVLALASILAFLSPDPAMIVFGAGAIGFCGGFLLILALALPPLLAPAGDVHRLSAGMFTISYLLSCMVPIAGGVLWDLTGAPKAAFAAAAASAAIVLATALTLPRVLRGGASGA